MRRLLIRGSAVRPLALLALLFSVLVTTLVAPLAARADDDAVKGKTEMDALVAYLQGLGTALPK